MRKEKDKNKKIENEEIDIISLNLNEDLNIKPKTEVKKQKQKKTGNKEFRRVSYLFVLLFLCMMGYLVYFNAVKSKDIIYSAYNVRLNTMADRVVRGQILDESGNILAKTEVDSEGNEQRVYPYGRMYAHVVGYDSHGKSGLESKENFTLLTSNAFFLEKISNEMKEEKNIGDNIITTLNTRVQEAAYTALGDYKGAVVVMEASTGKILAMVSKPDYNPNDIYEDWEEISTSEDSPLVNRVTQGSYALGSVFKLVTALAYIRENANYDNYNYECVGEIVNGETTIHCANNNKHGLVDLCDSLAYSCNTSLAYMGLNLKMSNYIDTAEDLLFNQKLPSVLPYVQSKFQLNKNSEESEIMMTAMGQGKTQVSPYHMALVTSAIANGGILMKPYLVEEVVNYTGVSIEKYMPEKYATLMTAEEAAQLKEYMSAVTEYGTGQYFYDSVYTAAGKTGTAEYSSDKEKAHSWFVGFTNVDNPELVISVVIESADNSGMKAISVAKRVFDAYYE